MFGATGAGEGGGEDGVSRARHNHQRVRRVAQILFRRVGGGWGFAMAAYGRGAIR